VVLSPDNRNLFVANFRSDTVASLDVASGGGSITLETDSPSGTSPFANPGGTLPCGIGMNRKGNLLYVANPNNVVTGFNVDRDGALTPLTPMNAFASRLIRLLRPVAVSPTNVKTPLVGRPSVDARKLIRVFPSCAYLIIFACFPDSHLLRMG